MVILRKPKTKKKKKLNILLPNELKIVCWKGKEDDLMIDSQSDTPISEKSTVESITKQPSLAQGIVDDDDENELRKAWTI